MASSRGLVVDYRRTYSGFITVELGVVRMLQFAGLAFIAYTLHSRE